MMPVVLAAAAWIGALAAAPIPVWVGPVVAVSGWRSRARPVLAAIAVGLLASSFASRSFEGLAPIASGQHDGEVTLVGDPEWVGPSVRVDVRVGGRRIEAWARGPSARLLANRLAGERVVVSGRLSPPPADAPWLVTRHVVGRLSVSEVGRWRHGNPATRLANGLRRTLAAGAEPMRDGDRALFLGLVLGDDRDQDPLVVDDFAGSGLTHLLAVSGSNVAFVIAVVGPLLARLRLGRRLVATLVVLAFFALVTRFEPSVLRATAMAGLGAVAVTFGWEAESRRVLPAAVVVLLLVDPLLARSLGFQLSVAASAGIVWWSARIALALPGPRIVAGPLAVTVAAQLAVAPLLIPTFGSMPVAALPANLLAAPAAGPVVVWGLPTGLVAGVMGEPFAGLLHLPTTAFVRWIGGVAGWSARLPLGDLRMSHLLALVAVAGAVVLARGGGRVRVAGAVAVAVLAVHPAWSLARMGDRVEGLGQGAVLHLVDGAVVVELSTGARPRPVLEGLRRAGVDRIDVVVAHDGGRDVAEVVALLAERSPPRVVLAPRGHRVPGGSVPPPGAVIGVGTLTVRVEAVVPRLEAVVEVTSTVGAAGTGGAGPV